MNPNDSVRVTTVVAVEPAEAFDLFTSDIDAWWRRGPRFRADGRRPSAMRFEPGIGGRLLEVYDAAGGDAFELGRVLDWEPPKRLRFEFRGRNFQPGEVTFVAVRFDPDPAGTLVTLEHSGWAALRLDHPVRHGAPEPAFIASMGGWWSELLGSLRRRAS